MPNIIYRILNTVNDKVYIGQTTLKPNFRWNHHKSNFRRKKKQTIYCAMRKYGIENFIFEEIFTVLNEDDLDGFEVQFIKLYNSYYNGYNMTKGGNVLRGENHPSFGVPLTLKQKKHLSKINSGKNNAHYGKIGKLSSRFSGYYHTPFGRLESTYEISKYTNDITGATLRKWCKKYSNKKICKNATSHSKYLTEDMLGKTYRELGFWFEPI